MLSAIDDPTNHSVPILDTFEDSINKSISYLVMPFLRLTDSPPFEVVEEVLDFVDQILEVRSGYEFIKLCVANAFSGSRLHAFTWRCTSVCLSHCDETMLILLLSYRDCSLKNVLMDATRMYPLGFHPVDDIFLDDLTTLAPVIPRLEVGVKYYFVDYGISSYFPAGSQRDLVLGIAGRDQDVPELSKVVPYDPFKVDIFTIGNVLRGEFQAVGFHPPG